jgi:2-methylfumaryl-CoA isomerase
VVETASFVAVPSAGMTLAQLGADVIRVDPPGGGADMHRWPLAANGESLFWANLNKGKRSVVIDYRTGPGRELLLELVSAPGELSGIFIDNMVGRQRLTYADVSARRADVIHVHLEGRRDGTPAVDYTINAEVGVPLMTGPGDAQTPVNHVLPAWDLLTGMTVTAMVTSALLRRRATGEGAHIDLALFDVALAAVGNLGWLAEADAAGAPRPRHGNHMYGAFGTDFSTSDRRRIMVVALTQGQWHALCRVTETGRVFAALEQVLGADLELEGDRYRFRETIASVLRPWFLQREFEAVRHSLDEARVLWSPYLDMAETARAAREEPDGVACELEQPGLGSMLATREPWRWNGPRSHPEAAPRLSAQTDDILQEVLGLTSAEIGRLRDQRVVG